MSSLIAKANTGTGTDSLAGVTTPDGFAGAVKLVDATGADISSGNPLSVTATVNPTGLATSAKQDTGNTSLGNIDADLGAQADAAASSDTGTFSLIALTKRKLQNWTTLLARTPALGAAAPSSSSPVVLPNDVTVTGGAITLPVINTDLLTNTVSGWYDAVNAHSVSIQIIGSVGLTAGQVIFEQTNDTTNAAAGNVWAVDENTTLTPTPNIAAFAIAASTTRMFSGAVIARYVRVRVSTAFTGSGTVQAVAVFSQLPYYRPVQTIHQATAANLNATVSGTVTSNIGTGTLAAVTSANLGIPGIIADVASAALTTTTTTAAITPTFGTSYEVNIPVTVVSGTTPTLDVTVQESGDTATNWTDVYTFPRITTTGFYRSPPLKLRGNRIRYVQTVGGTTPSFTRAVNRLQASIDATNLVRQTMLSAQTTTGQGLWYTDMGKLPSFAAYVAGTGAVTATIKIWGRSIAGLGPILLGTITLSGTTNAADAGVINYRYIEYMAEITAISGTGAAVTVVMAS